VWVSSPFWNTGIDSNDSWSVEVSTVGWPTNTELKIITKGVAPSGYQENDGDGNVAAARTIIIDDTKPIAGITRPINALYNSLTTLSGTADDPSIGEINKVTFTVKRNIDNLYWNIDLSTYTVYTATACAMTGSNPAGTVRTYTDSDFLSNLPWEYGKLYTIYIVATDKAGNTNIEVSRQFTYDTQAPIANLDIPLNGAFIKSLTTLSGDVSDPAPGVVGNVQVMLRRVGGSYFNGSNFTGSTTSWFDATVYASSWTFSHANLSFTPDKIYRVIVRSSDTAGNVQSIFASGVSSNTFVYEANPPLTGITYPELDESYKSTDLANLAGTANDPGSNPSGISAGNVEIRLYYIYGGDTYYSDGLETFSSTTAPGSAYFDATDVASWYYASDQISWVSDRDYYIEARALDNATLADGTGTGNQGSVCQRQHFIIDDSTPSVEITVPDQPVVTALPTLSGTADAAHSGTDSVEVTIQRITGSYGDNYYWTGSSWSPNIEWQTTDLFGSGTGWYYGTPVTWNDNTEYQIQARATDKAGNVSATIDSYDVTLDTSIPTAGITRPVNSEFYSTPALGRSLVTISGTANDPGSQSSGVDEVWLYIIDISSTPDYYFNGTNYTSSISSVQASGTGIWTYTNANLYFTDTREFRVQAKAIDGEGNASSWGSTSSQFFFDETEPDSLVQYPENNIYYQSITVYSGTASDITAGVNSVEISVERVDDTMYWNGSNWVDGSGGASYFSASGDETWNKSGAGMPTLDDDEQYRVKARATDDALITETDLGAGNVFYIDT
ncbi:MAG: hypothetical protein GF384_03745, partial [Elusimicrobia bacterium]|nr:hypothetical protein [Elusimicrobiota bacterium]